MNEEKRTETMEVTIYEKKEILKKRAFKEKMDYIAKILIPKYINAIKDNFSIVKGFDYQTIFNGTMNQLTLYLPPDARGIYYQDLVVDYLVKTFPDEDWRHFTISTKNLETIKRIDGEIINE